VVFSSNLFLFIFLPLTLAGHFLAPKKLKNGFLLAMSLLFYAWGEPKVVLVMLASILFNWLMGLLADRFGPDSANKWLRRLLLMITVAGNLGMLFYYKYFDFFISNVNRLAGTAIPLRHIALPIGISFFTFQSLSYVLDLYMGKVNVQRNPFKLALYVALFPQLIAGPIVRYIDVNAQIDERHVTLEGFAEGIRRFAIGLVKKMLIANQTALIADQIFALPFGSASRGAVWLAVLCYAFQIYFDFSGYSDMAIGLGKMLGFDFLENFRYPYISRSITEFWRRWHISLSSWFRDYVYIPLGGNRRGNRYFNLFVVFFLTGMWHGASWNYIVWGLWNGLFLIAEKPLMKTAFYQKIPAFIRWAVTMLLVLIGWVFFRIEDMGLCLEYLSVMFGFASAETAVYAASWFIGKKLIFVLGIAALASIPWKEAGRSGQKLTAFLQTTSGHIAVCAASAVLLLMGIMLCMTSTYNPFIYFRF